MNVLMVTWDAGGNLPPFLGLGHELQRRGHRVRCLAPEPTRAAVTQAEIVFRPLQHGAVFNPLAPLRPEQSQEAQARVFFDDGYRADLRAEVDEEQPDIVVVDCFLVSAQAAVEAMGVPLALLVHTLPGWFVPFWDRVLLPPTNAMRERVNLSTVRSTAELWARADRTLVASTQVLDRPRRDLNALPGVRYVGPISEPQDGKDRAAAVPSTSEPLVLVSFSTTFMDQQDALARTIAALRALPVQALVTSGPAINTTALPPARNVAVRRWLPHAALLPRTALVVTQGGHSTVVKALAYGVPLLCIPLGRDQRFIAERVEAVGAGLALPPDAGPDALATAITSLMRDPSYREAAQRVRSAIQAAGPGAANAVAGLEAITPKRA